jgi:cyclopropane fatty-acyl-phospholipid synthase-like methyltransferase
MGNKTLEESIIAAMELPNSGLVRHLSYIFQDWWELGSSPDEIIKIIKKFKTNYSDLNVLDLGSGKGAVSIKISSELKCNCFGIDGIDDFVNFSNNKAKEYSLENICTFETNDIRTRIKSLKSYDIILLMAIGPVFGDYFETLTELSSHLSSDGLFIINDAYVENNCNKDYPNIFRETEITDQVNKAGMELIYQITINEISGTRQKYENEYNNIRKRCVELAEKYPEDKEMFFKYEKKKKREYEILREEIVPAIFVIRNKI